MKSKCVQCRKAINKPEPGCVRCKVCRDKRRAARKRWREANYDRYLELCRKNNRTPGSRKAVRAYQHANRERFKAWHADYFREWSRTNRARIAFGKEVKLAVAAGEIIKPMKCSTCPRTDGIRPLLVSLDLERVTWHCPACHQSESFKARKSAK